MAEAVDPEVAVASAGFTNSHEHPRRGVIQRLEWFTDTAQAHSLRWGWRVGHNRNFWTFPTYREAIYSTATNGNIVIRSDGSSYEVLLNQ